MAEPATPKAPSSPERGLLHLSVELSTREVVAGSDFSLFVVVTNPFPNPINVSRVHVSLPSELALAGSNLSEESRLRYRQRETEIVERNRQNTEILKKPLTELRDSVNKIRQLLESRDDDAALKAPSDTIQEKLNAVDRTLEEVELATRSAQVSVEGGHIQNLTLASSAAQVRVSNSLLDDAVGHIQNLVIQDPWLVAEARSAAQEVELQSSLPKGSALQPGNMVVFTTVIRAKSPLTISPSKFRLQFSVNYSFPSDEGGASAVHTNTISQEITVRAPVYAVMLGAVVGGFFGAVARILQFWGSPPSASSPFLSIMLAVILSGAAVVFLARKSDAQAFISVEDIWGGALIGFLVGYSGTSFFDQLAKIPH